VLRGDAGGAAGKNRGYVPGLESLGSAQIAASDASSTSTTASIDTGGATAGNSGHTPPGLAKHGGVPPGHAKRG